MLSKIYAYYTSKGPKRWVLWAYISIGMLLMSLSFAVWRMKKNKELAQLRAKALQTDLQISKVRLDMSNAADMQVVTALAAKAKELRRTASNLRADIITNELLVADKLKHLQELKTWADLDTHNKQGRS